MLLTSQVGGAVQPVVLARLGELAHVTGVHDGHGQAGGIEGDGRQPLEPPEASMTMSFGCSFASCRTVRDALVILGYAPCGPVGRTAVEPVSTSTTNTF